MRIIELSEAETSQLMVVLSGAENGQTLKVAIDGYGFKYKLGEGMWSPSLGHALAGAPTRIAYHADESFMGDNGDYAVVAIEDNEPGYWTVEWQPTLAQAKVKADRRNKDNGLTDQDVLDIRTSSMVASNRR